MKLIFKRGGGGTGDAFQQIPEWLQPYLANQLETKQQAFTTGALSPVTGFTDTQIAGQQAALDAAVGAGGQQDVAGHSVSALNQLGRIAGGEEIVPATTGATDAIKQAAVRQAQIRQGQVDAGNAARGAVGGSRQLLQAGEAQNDLASKLAGIDYQDLQARRTAAQNAASGAIQGGASVQQQLLQPSTTIRQVGAEQQGLQKELDRQTLTGLQNLSTLTQGTPWQSQQQIQQGAK